MNKKNKNANTSTSSGVDQLIAKARQERGVEAPSSSTPSSPAPSSAKPATGGTPSGEINVDDII